MNSKQNRVRLLQRMIEAACVFYGFNLTVYDGKIGFVDQQAKKIIALWEPQF